MTSKSSLLVHGMHGLGDNLHQRAIIRALLKRDYQIALETAWPCVYHDLAGPDLRFIRKPAALRAQLKNAVRESAKFTAPIMPHHGGRAVQITYRPSGIPQMPSNTFLEAMFASVGIQEDYASADFRLPIPPEWIAPTIETTKPIMIYRPLVVRPEWRGSGIRNADPDNYAELVAMVRDSFFVVSVADLEENREWIVGPQLIADATFHHGELSFETMAALVAKAALVYTSSGFPAILGPAVGAPTVSVQGGLEPAAWHADGAKYSPYLGIDTLAPCNCGVGHCDRHCTKKLDMPRARAAVAEFVGKLGISTAAETRPLSEIFIPAAHPPAPCRTAPEPRVMPRVRVGHPSLLNQRRPPVRA
jgi:hypothetical protein